MRMTKTAALAAVAVLALAACKQNANENATTTTTTTENASGTATSAEGGDAVNGTWKTDLASIKIDSKPDQFMLKDGKFSCPTCTPPIAVAADGAFHPVDRPYADHMSVKVDDDHNVTRTNQKGGKTTFQQKFSVSADGNTLTSKFNDTSGEKPVTGTFVETRVGPAPAGAHAMSGSWQPQRPTNLSDEALTFTITADNDMLHLRTPAGQSYDAKLDGTETPIKGDIGGTTASVKKLGPGSYQETDRRRGKVTNVITITVGADGKLNVKDENKQDGSTTTSIATKQ
ncbi:MAG TPA: hypothetical protein VF750_03955 [Sphingomicrobium sp.]